MNKLTAMKMKAQGLVLPPKYGTKGYDDDWVQDGRYYDVGEDTGDFNVKAQISLEMLKESIESFVKLDKKYKLSVNEKSEHKRLVKIANTKHEFTKRANLMNQDTPKNYKDCQNASLDVWEHGYRLKERFEL
jgi:hypothetical protein